MEVVGWPERSEGRGESVGFIGRRRPLWELVYKGTQRCSLVNEVPPGRQLPKKVNIPIMTFRI